MEEIRIPNRATYSPVALMDVVLTAPLVSRLLFRSAAPGRALQLVALGAYAGSALVDWTRRQRVRPIDFLLEFGADVRHLRAMPRAAREAEVRALVERLNDGYVPDRLPLPELAVRVDRHLTETIARITGQRVRTSTEIRTVSLARAFFPFALGATDLLSGDVALFRDTGIFEPHVVAHEFAHRKGHWRELDAQALAYLALAGSGDPVLVQSALAERLHRDLAVLAGPDAAAYRARVRRAGLRPELEAQFLALRPLPGRIERALTPALRALYDRRLRMTGQNGLSDYDLGFTNFLYTFETSRTARQRPPAAGTFHRPE